MKEVCGNLICFTTRLYLGAMSVLNRKEGQTLVEYALLLLLIAIVVLVAVAFVGERTSNFYSGMADKIPNS